MRCVTHAALARPLQVQCGGMCACTNHQRGVSSSTGVTVMCLPLTLSAGAEGAIESSQRYAGTIAGSVYISRRTVSPTRPPSRYNVDFVLKRISPGFFV